MFVGKPSQNKCIFIKETRVTIPFRHKPLSNENSSMILKKRFSNFVNRKIIVNAMN